MYTKKHMNNSTGRWETMALSEKEISEIKDAAEAWVDGLSRKMIKKATDIAGDYSLSTQVMIALVPAMMEAYIKTVYSEAQQKLDEKIYNREAQQ